MGKGSGQGGKRGSSGKHRPKAGKIRQGGANASERKQAERDKQARIAKQREEAEKARKQAEKDKNK